MTKRDIAKLWTLMEWHADRCNENYKIDPKMNSFRDKAARLLQDTHGVLRYLAQNNKLRGL
jgi:hypothetical protein